MKRLTKMTLSTLVSIAGLGVLPAQANTITLSDASFSRLYNTSQDGLGDIATTHTIFLGTKSNQDGFDGHGGYAFQMTGASAADLLTADFSVSITNITGTPLYNVDVYANRVALTADFLASDFEDGTKIMDDFVTTSDTIGSNHSLDSTGQANLLSYLGNNWVENSYVFLTLKANTDDNNFIMGEDANAFYLFGGSTTWSAGATDAQLVVTTVPEPATTGMLLGLGVMTLLFIRRR